jgi:hypothetical protein
MPVSRRDAIAPSDNGLEGPIKKETSILIPSDFVKYECSRHSAQ